MRSRDAGGAAAGEAPSRVTLAAPPSSRGAGPGVTRPPAPALGPDLVRVLQLARRRLQLAVLIAVLLTAAAAAVVLRLPNRYTAEALVVLNDRPSKLAELGSPTESLISRTPGRPLDRQDPDRDPHLRRHAARRCRAARPPTTRLSSRRVQPPAGTLAVAGGALATWPRRGPRGPATAALRSRRRGEAGPGRHRGERGRLLRAPLARGDRRRRPLGRDRERACRVYLAGPARPAAANAASGIGWLSDRLRELRATVLRADDAVERYRGRAPARPGGRAEPARQQNLPAQQRADRRGARLGRAQANLAEADAATRRGGDLASAGPCSPEPPGAAAAGGRHPGPQEHTAAAVRAAAPAGGRNPGPARREPGPKSGWRWTGSWPACAAR